MIPIKEEDRVDKKVTPRTKVLIKKLNRGKEPNSKYWKSYFDDKQKKSNANHRNEGPSLLKQSAALVSGLVVGFAIILYIMRPDIIEKFTNSVTSVFHNSGDVRPDYKIREFSYSDQSKRSTIYEQNQKHETSPKSIVTSSTPSKKYTNANFGYSSPVIGKGTSKLPYQLEIEFFNGKKFYVDNADIKENTVSYKRSDGVIVSFNKEQIKNMKWVNAF